MALVYTLPWRKKVGTPALVERNEQVGAIVAPRLVHAGCVQLRLGHLHDRLGGWGEAREMEVAPPGTGGDERRQSGNSDGAQGSDKCKGKTLGKTYDGVVRSRHLTQSSTMWHKKQKKNTHELHRCE